MHCLFVEHDVNCLEGEEVGNLGVVHGEQPLRLLAGAQAGLPQLLLDAQLQHDALDVSVPVLQTLQLLHLSLVNNLKVRVESRLDAMNHILHLEL